MHIAKGWLDTAKKIESPNADLRPDENDISLLVIHNISLPPEQFGGPYIEQLFSNSLNPHEHPYFQDIYNLKVSSHLLIDREGKITQFVPFNKRAWHAGVSEFQGRQRCNDFSIGIELEGADHIAFSDIQYATLTAVSQHSTINFGFSLKSLLDVNGIQCSLSELGTDVLFSELIIKF